MTQVILFLQDHIAEITCFALLLLLVFAGVLLQKISVIKNRLDGITGRVEDYFSAILEEEEVQAGGDFLEKWAASTEAEPQEDDLAKKKGSPEEQNQLISAVLKEIFP